MTSHEHKRGFVGQPIRRFEDPALVTGRGRFSGDLAASHWVRFVRSPVASGRIIGIAAPPGARVITAADVAASKLPREPIALRDGFAVAASAVADAGSYTPMPFASPPPRVDAGGFYCTTGVGPDLYAAAQDAVRAMVAHLVRTRGLTPEDAYVLSSICVDLKISEIVDGGQYIVSAVLPLAVFSH